MKKHARKLLKKARRVHRVIQRKMHSHIVPFSLVISMLLGVASLTTLGYTIYKGDVRPYKEPHMNMSAQRIFELGTEAFHVYLECTKKDNRKKNEEAFDNAVDYFSEAYSRNKNAQPLDAFIAQEYLVILSAMHSARSGYRDKYREAAADKLRVARDKLIEKKKDVVASTSLSTKQKYTSVQSLDNAINLLLQTMLHLSKEEGVYTKKRIYLSLAQETTQMMS